jgi:hypothetical protein
MTDASQTRYLRREQVSARNRNGSGFAHRPRGAGRQLTAPKASSDLAAGGISAAITRTARSVSRACPMAASSARSRRSIASRRWGLKVSNSRARGTSADVCTRAGSRSGGRSTRCSCRCISTLSRQAGPEAPQVRRAAMFTGVSAFQMGLIHIIAGMMGRACSSTIRASKCRLARAAPAGSPMRCTAWISNSRTASAT